MSDQTLTLLAIALFAASEIIGLNPRWRDNTVLQVLLRLTRNALRPNLPADSPFRDR